MAELTRNSDLVEMGVDEFPAPVKDKGKVKNKKSPAEKAKPKGKKK